MKSGFSWMLLAIFLMGLLVGTVSVTVFLTQTSSGNTTYTTLGGTCPTCPTKVCPPWNGVCTQQIVDQCCEEEGGKPLPTETCTSITPSSDIGSDGPYDTPYTDIKNELIDACNVGTCIIGLCEPSVDADGYFTGCACR